MRPLVPTDPPTGRPSNVVREGGGRPTGRLRDVIVGLGPVTRRDGLGQQGEHAAVVGGKTCGDTGLDPGLAINVGVLDRLVDCPRANLWRCLIHAVGAEIAIDTLESGPVSCRVVPVKPHVGAMACCGPDGQTEFGQFGDEIGPASRMFSSSFQRRSPALTARPPDPMDPNEKKDQKDQKEQKDGGAK